MRRWWNYSRVLQGCKVIQLRTSINSVVQNDTVSEYSVKIVSSNGQFEPKLVNI